MFTFQFIGNKNTVSVCRDRWVSNVETNHCWVISFLFGLGSKQKQERQGSDTDESTATHKDRSALSLNTLYKKQWCTHLFPEYGWPRFCRLGEQRTWREPWRHTSPFLWRGQLWKDLIKVSLDALFIYNHTT